MSSGHSNVHLPSDENVVASTVCGKHLETALGEFLEALPDLTAELGGAFDTFGQICDEAMDQTMGTFDALASDFEGTLAKELKRAELHRQILKKLEPIYRVQIKQLDELSWDRMRNNLAKLRLGDPSLLKEMELSVKDADAFFRDTAKLMLCGGAPWSAEQERRDMVTKMRKFVTERLQAARLQGSYVPGMLRRPIAVSLHYLATHPFQILDVLQDSLSYEEDMNWEPNPALRMDSDNLKDMKGASSLTSKMSMRAER